MIKDDFYGSISGSVYDLKNGTESSLLMQNIPIDGETFSDAYWLGWVKPKNAPRWAGASEFLFEDGRLNFKPLISSNYDVGYVICRGGAEFLPKALNFYYSSAGKWNSFVTNSQYYLPNKVSLAHSAVSQRFKFHCYRAVGRYSATVTPPNGGEFTDFTSTGFVQFECTLDEVRNPTDRVVISWHPPQLKDEINVDITLDDIRYGVYRRIFSNSDLTAATAKQYSYIEVFFVLTSGSVAYENPCGDDGTSTGKPYSLIPMIRSEFTTSRFSAESSSVVAVSPLGINWADSSEFPSGIQLSKSKDGLLIAGQQGKSVPYNASGGLKNEGIIKNIGQKRATLYGCWEASFDAADFERVCFISSENLCAFNNSAKSDSGSMFVTPLYSFEEALHDYGFNSRIAKTDFSELSGDEKVKVDSFYYPQVRSSGEFTGKLTEPTEANKTQTLQEWQYSSDIAETNTYDPADKPPYSPFEGAFRNAVNLRRAAIPKSVKSIGEFSFEKTALTHVKIAADCEISETSFPENCRIIRYEETETGQLYDSGGRAVLDVNGARIYVKKENENG